MKNTPICDFIRDYEKKSPLRLHMPGHKGLYGYGADITEIRGADSLYAPDGIIRESEKNAGLLFDAKTLYSAEGSSLSIRAMLYLARLHALEKGETPRILAVRNAHKAFIGAVALLDFAVDWLFGAPAYSHLSCPLDPSDLEKALTEKRYTAVYCTSPDYLGHMQDISALSAICHKHGVLLLVDNAHGAYLRFLPHSLHPISLGADMCADSAHKTLPVLTGGGYLHLAKSLPSALLSGAKEAMALFGSTSPSYLILASLDRANPILHTYPAVLSRFLPHAEEARRALEKGGYTLVGQEPLKLTIKASSYGYTGREIAEFLEENGVYPEFADPDFLVLMITPETGEAGLRRTVSLLLSLPKKEPLSTLPPRISPPTPVCSPKIALLSPRETVLAKHAKGRILATEHTGCPPAVPLVMAGERIGEDAVRAFAYYGTETCAVLKEEPCLC